MLNVTYRLLINTNVPQCTDNTSTPTIGDTRTLEHPYEDVN